MNHGWTVLCCTFTLVLAAGCSAGPTSDDTDTTTVFDAQDIEITADTAGDTVPDAEADDAVETDVSPDVPVGPVDAADDTAVADPVMELAGAFRFDFLSTETGLLDRFITLGDADRHAAAVNRCGTMAVVYADRYEDNGFATSLVFSEVDLKSPPDIDSLIGRRVLLTRTSTTETPAMTASVVYSCSKDDCADDPCTPMVFVKTDTGWDWTVPGDGETIWTAVDPAHTWTEIVTMGAQVGRDDKIHLVFRGRPTGSTLQWADAVFNGTSFDTALFTRPDAAMTAPIDVAIDGDGRLVIGYRRTGTVGEEAWVAHWTGSAWQTEQITGVTTSDLGSSFAIGSYGREALAWTAAVKSGDGILLSASLKYTYRDTDNSFKTETVTVENDGYVGSGNRFTGGSPSLTIDRTGRPHIIYSDLAVIYDGDSQTVYAGQLRYAWRRVSQWNRMTVFSQESPDTDAQPITGFRAVATSPDGTAAGLVGVAQVPDRFGNLTLDTRGWSVLNAQ